MTDKRERDAQADLEEARTGALHHYAHQRFGGIDVPAALAGMLAGFAALALLSAIVAAAAGSAVEQPLTALQESSIGAALASLAIVIVAFLVGGWATGRMARYDGVKNGALAGVFAVLLMVLLGAGAWFAGQELAMVPAIDVAALFEQQAGVAALGALLAVAAIILSAALGGMLGERYHEKIDERMESLALDRTRLLETHHSENLRDSNSARASEAGSTRSHRRREPGL